MGFIVLLNALVIIIVNICSLPSVNYQLTLQKFVKICGILFDKTQNVEFLQSIRIIWSSDYVSFLIYIEGRGVDTYFLDFNFFYYNLPKLQFKYKIDANIF